MSHAKALRRKNKEERISHRPTQTHTDIYPADFAGQKMSSLREKSEV